MPDTTPNYNLPKPNDADTLRAAVRDIPRDLADRLDVVFAGISGLGSSTVTATNNGMSGFARAYVRGFHATILAELTATAARPAFATIAFFGTPIRPTTTVQGLAWNLTTGAAVPVYVTAAGELVTRNALTSGHQILLSLPVPF